MRKLEKLITMARKIIVKLYIDCEKDFEKGLQIFEAIVEKVRFDTSLRRLENLNKNISDLSSDPVSNEIDEDDDVEDQQTGNDKTTDDPYDPEQLEKNAEEIAAKKSCLRYPGWRKYTDAPEEVSG